jgi:hypothetical protein
MPIPLTAAGLAALRVISGVKLARTTGGIVGPGSKAVNPVYKNMTDKIQSNSVKVTKTQAQINKEGLEKVRQALNIPAKGTPAYQRYLASKASKENVALMKSRIKGK